MKERVIPIVPLLCPECRKPVQFCGPHYICWDCGELIPYPKEGVWKIRKFCNACYAEKSDKIYEEEPNYGKSESEN